MSARPASTDPVSGLRNLKVVALGGGHGLAASLRALCLVATDLTAVVGVGDDGGSSGRIRAELNVAPPGDLRMALAALCSDDDWGQTWSRVIQHRFGGSGELAGHALGNLLIAALWEETGDLVAGLDWAAALLRTSGRVLPAACEGVDLVAEVQTPDGPAEVRGQVAIATTRFPVVSLRLEPPLPAVCAEAVTAIHDADLVVLGPGSWFTSVLPHVMMPHLGAALRETSARRVVVINVSPQTGETTGFTASTYLQTLSAHAPDMPVDAVVLDTADSGEADLVRALHPNCLVHVGRVRDGDDGTRHDPVRLAEAFRQVADGLLPTRRLAPWR